MARPLSERKLDIIYLVYFIIHIPVMFLVDFVGLYPAHLVPTLLVNIRTFYITTYRDQFFIAPPAWFNTYTWMELLYHLPLSFWAVGALIRDDAKVPLHLLVYSVQCGLTTLTCIADYLSWQNFSLDEKINLGKLYVPYLAIAVFMGVDMFGRLDAVISRTTTLAKGKKGL